MSEQLNKKKLGQKRVISVNFEHHRFNVVGFDLLVVAKSDRLLVGVLTVSTHCLAQDQAMNRLESFITDFSYETRKDMKIDSKTLIQKLKEGKAQLIDIRFEEEYAAWHINPSINIPLNKLPNRMDEIDKTKIVVTACPHKDRAAIAMVYLRSHSIDAKYLTDGLTGMAENLRGDNAKAYIESLR